MFCAAFLSRKNNLLDFNIKIGTQTSLSVFDQSLVISCHNFETASFYNHIKLTAVRTFPETFIYFFVYAIIFRWRGLFCMILNMYFTIFCRYYCSHDVKVDAIFF